MVASRFVRQLVTGLLVATIMGCSPSPSGSPAASAIERIVISPAAILMTAVGQKTSLTAKAFTASGDAVSSGISWTSSRTGVAAIDSSGTLTAASLGASQITATARGVSSAPILALVTAPAAGVKLVTDDQIKSDPADTDPNATPSMANTYHVVVSGFTPTIGDLLLGTGGRALAGRVTAVETGSGGKATLTMALVPLNTLLPGLELNEVLDLTNAEVSVRDDVARLYDVTRDGNTFTFSPKPDFETLVGSTSALQLAAFHTAGPGGAPGLAAGAIGTTALPPFSDCTSTLTNVPIQVAGAPSFKVELKPSLDLVYTSAHGLERFVVHAAPKATVFAGFKVNAAFEGKLACELELFALRIPIGGPLSLILGGLVPVGVGVDLGGKVTVATMAIGTTVEASATASAGISCPGGTDCTFERSLSDFSLKATPTIDAPSLADIRLQPSLSAYAYLKATIGNPFLKSLRFDAFKAKVGGKLAADWAPATVQILDTSYASNFKLSIEASASLANDLSGVLKLLGLSKIAAAELVISTNLAQSPTGGVVADKADYHAGDTATIHVNVDPANLTFLTLYDVVRIQLVRYSGGALTVLGTTTASDGQTDFPFTFVAPDHVSASELHAFVVTKIPSLDLFALELAQTGSAGPGPGSTPQGPLGAVIQVAHLITVPVAGICQSVPLQFGIGHADGSVSLATGATWSATGDGSLDPATPDAPAKLIFRAGTVAGSATIIANGYIIDPHNTINATLTLTIDPLVGIYRDPSTKTQLVVESGLGHSLPAGTYWLLVSGVAAPLGVAPSGSAFVGSSGGHTIDLSINPGSATGTVDGQSVNLARVCGP